MNMEKGDYINSYMPPRASTWSPKPARLVAPEWQVPKRLRWWRSTPKRAWMGDSE